MSELSKALESNPAWKTQYEYLLSRQKIAQKALDDFTSRILRENSIAVAVESITDLKDAKSYLDRLLKDEVFKGKLVKMVQTQRNFEQRWERAYKEINATFSGGPGAHDARLQSLVDDCHAQLEAFQNKCLLNLRALKVPLFIDLNLKQITDNQRELINYIHETLNNQ